MAKTLRITGDYTIDPTGILYINSDVEITGDLTVTGTTTTVDTVDLEIQDNIVLLNRGETGAGVTLGTAGIEVDRGTLDNAAIIFDESDDLWKISSGSSFDPILTAGGAGGALGAVSDDPAPTLGGDLNTDGNSITANTNQDVVISPIGTGELVVDSVLTLTDQVSAPSGSATETKLYAATAGEGETGLFFVDNTVTGELIQKNKAIVYAMLF